MQVWQLVAMLLKADQTAEVGLEERKISCCDPHCPCNGSHTEVKSIRVTTTADQNVLIS